LATQSTDLAVVGVPVKDAFVAFANETGRKVRARGGQTWQAWSVPGAFSHDT
jgi:hypothetical protein